MAILEACADEVGHYVGPDSLLIEIGSGASKKIRLLLETLRPQRYLGVDISRRFLLESAARLADDYPWLDVEAICADFTSEWRLPEGHAAGRKVVFFPGSTIGNLEPGEAFGFLIRMRMLLQADGALLVGVDLRKDVPTLDAAYNDSAGVTAAFNLNLLERLRDELGADFDRRGFAHCAFFNPSASRIEMHLVSRRAQEMYVRGRRFRFAAGETIHTENSYKYSIDQFQSLARLSGFQPVQVWTDEAALFSVHLLRVAA
jgi:dimethylhistidine N-methyltransferase